MKKNITLALLLTDLSQACFKGAGDVNLIGATIQNGGSGIRVCRFWFGKTCL
jgi:hypothetical protein